MLARYPVAGVGRPAVLACVRTTGDPVPLHTSERIWTETNCYLDLWIEALGRFGVDPRPVLGPALRAGTDSSQWSFVKPEPTELRRLYGIEVTELNVWRPLLEHVEETLAAGASLTVEVDSYWLPDTEGVGYRTAHGKTSLLPVAVDRTRGTLTYLHNSGCHELSGEDFAAVFGSADGSGADAASLAAAGNLVPLPYVERVGLPERVTPADPPVAVDLLRAHAADADPDAVRPLAERVLADLPWIGEAGPEGFHLWSFGTLRAAGSTAELCGDVCDWLAATDPGVTGVDRAGAAEAATSFRSCAETAKSVQFRLARAARGRAVDPSGGLDGMAASLERGVDLLTGALGVTSR